MNIRLELLVTPLILKISFFKIVLDFILFEAKIVLDFSMIDSGVDFWDMMARENVI